MIKYSGVRLIRTGFIGVVLIILIIAVGLQPERLVSMATSARYAALFAEAGGLAVGNDVKIGGVKVGSISGVALSGGDASIRFTVNSSIPLGSQTSAHIRTGSLLGERVLVLESAGAGSMAPNSVIPLTRTSSPYSLTDAVSDLTSNVADTNTASLNQSLDTLTSDDRSNRAATRPHIRRVDPTVEVIEQPQRDAGRTVRARKQRHRDSRPAQRSTEHAALGRQRPDGRSGRTSASHRQSAD